MRYVIVFAVSLLVLFLFLFSGTVIYAAQATADLKKPVEQCIKGGKVLPTVKTKDSCIQKGGVWTKKEASKIPPDPFGKSKAMPPDPLDKRKAMPSEPIEPLDKGARTSPLIPDYGPGAKPSPVTR
ncbi:MAG TPA: hypothetical protein PLX02_15585 [Syntrophorhabdaceae bacterium]|nr:hypothetical protein [Syntrophorhabdaceae bacterium]